MEVKKSTTCKLRNITDGELDVRLAGRNYGTVPPDGVLEVDVDTYRSVVWPESVWSEVDVSAAYQ